MYSPMSIEETETEDGDPVSDLTIASAEDNNVGQVETDGEEEPELDEDGGVYAQSPTPSLPSTHPDDLDALCPVLDTAEAETDEEELDIDEDGAYWRYSTIDEDDEFWMYSPMSIEETETEDGDPVSDLTIASAEDNNVGQVETDGEEEPDFDEDGDVYVQSPTPSLPSTHPGDLDALCPVLDTAEAETDEEELDIDEDDEFWMYSPMSIEETETED